MQNETLKIFPEPIVPFSKNRTNYTSQKKKKITEKDLDKMLPKKPEPLFRTEAP